MTAVRALLSCVARMILRRSLRAMDIPMELVDEEARQRTGPGSMGWTGSGTLRPRRRGNVDARLVLKMAVVVARLPKSKPGSHDHAGFASDAVVLTLFIVLVAVRVALTDGPGGERGKGWFCPGSRPHWTSATSASRGPDLEGLALQRRPPSADPGLYELELPLCFVAGGRSRFDVTCSTCTVSGGGSPSWSRARRDEVCGQGSAASARAPQSGRGCRVGEEAQGFPLRCATVQPSVRRTWAVYGASRRVGCQLPVAGRSISPTEWRRRSTTTAAIAPRRSSDETWAGPSRPRSFSASRVLEPPRLQRTVPALSAQLEPAVPAHAPDVGWREQWARAEESARTKVLLPRLSQSHLEVVALNEHLCTLACTPPDRQCQDLYVTASRPSAPARQKTVVVRARTII
jgi:hypothetical protein